MSSENYIVQLQKTYGLLTKRAANFGRLFSFLSQKNLATAISLKIYRQFSWRNGKDQGNDLKLL